MKKVFPLILFLCLYLFLIKISASSEKRSNEIKLIIETVNNKLPQIMKKYNASGSFVVISNKKGTVWLKCFGQLSKTDNTPVNSKTIFGVGSVSKMFTATGVMFAAQNKLLELDTPIKKYIPNFSIKSRFSENPIEQITMRDLLSHRSGLPRSAPLGNICESVGAVEFDKYIRSIKDVWIKFPVDQRTSYSNIGFDLAGYILEKLSGKPFPEYMQKNVLTLLNMETSSFDIEKVKKNKNRTIGFVSDNTNNIPIIDSLVASGGLLINAVDFGKFLTFQLNDGTYEGKQLLNKKYIKEMRTIPHKMYNQIEGRALGINKEIIKNATIYYHTGTGLGFASKVIWIPKFDFALAITVNSETARGKLDSIVGNIISILKTNYALNKKLKDSSLGEKKYLIKNISRDKLNKWTGTYLKTTLYSQIEIKFKNNIFGIDCYGKFIPLEYIGNYRFYAKSEDTIYIFKNAGKYYPKYILNTKKGDTWNYDHSMNNKYGPNKKYWNKFIGNYKIPNWKKQNINGKLYIQNGYLFLTVNFEMWGRIASWNFRLKEFNKNIFVTSNGVILDLHVKPFTFNSLKMIKE